MRDRNSDALLPDKGSDLIGHNGGPSMEPGTGWRRHCWRTAREALLPRLPIEVVRLRVKRAAAIGLDYRTYAGVRAATGEDVVALLFSSNALRILREGEALEAARRAKLIETKDVGRVVAAQPPLRPERLRVALAGQGVEFHHAAAAPPVTRTWGELRAEVLAMLKPGRFPADRVLLIGETACEREWLGAARLAGFLTSEQYFGGRS